MIGLTAVTEGLTLTLSGSGPTCVHRTDSLVYTVEREGKREVNKLGRTEASTLSLGGS